MKLFGKTALAVSLTLAATLAAAQTQTNLSGYVNHVIIVIQENRTPTNLFQQDSALVPNAAHLSAYGLCNPNPDQSFPLHADSFYTCYDPSHNHGQTPNPKSSPDWENMWDNGLMDGACNIPYGTQCTPTWSCPDTHWSFCPSMAYVQNAAKGSYGILQPYFDLANQYGYANYMFSTSQGPSFPGHQFLFSGTSAPMGYSTVNPTCYDTSGRGYACYKWFDAENESPGDGATFGCASVNDGTPYAYDIDPHFDVESLAYNSGYPCYTHNSLPTLLDPAGITWRYYLREGGKNQNGYTLWNAAAVIDDICHQHVGQEHGKACDTSDYKNNVNYFLPGGPNYLGDYAPILTDIENCNLPQVSWVIPDGNWSDHGANDPGDGGPSWVAHIVNAVGQNGACPTGTPNAGELLWKDTVILVVWDDWGGLYDDVPPPSIGYQNSGNPPNGVQYVYGFRVPLLVIGAYTNTTTTGKNGFTGYISGPGDSPNCYPPPSYCHDFGSILNFIEYAFGTGGYPLGIAPKQYGISQDQHWPYADYFAMDYAAHVQYSYSLKDFFNFSQGGYHSYAPINSWYYPEYCFHQGPNSGCWKTYPLDPDNDANETD